MAAAGSASTVPTAMSGSWKANLTRSDDFEPFLLEVGVPWAIRKIAKRSTPVVAIAVTEKAFRQQASGPMGKKVDNGGEFGTEVDWTSPGGVSKMKIDLIDSAVVLTGASPNPKDKDGVMTSHYTMGDDGTVRVCLRIKRGNGTELVINRVLDRVA